MHENTWQEESGFCTDTFVSHIELLAKYNDSTELISAELSDANNVVAVLIGFVHKDTFYYYLSANENSTNNKIKYGLSLHHFVIQWCSQQGLKHYDFWREITATSVHLLTTHFSSATYFSTPFFKDET